MKRFLPLAVIMAVFALHIIYLLVIRPQSCGPAPTFSDYFSNGDAFLGFSYAFGAAFSLWSLGEFMRCRSAAWATAR